jgi:hypothetical protein
VKFSAILALVRQIGVLAAVALGSVAQAAEEPAKRLAEGIQDNSFLVEEAYNQEVGVVQHVLNIVPQITRRAAGDNRELLFAFTQEWPAFSQAHQLSYTIPYSFNDVDGRSENGLGDISVHYRYQALMESDHVPAFAPSFSLILPTGDASKGLGDDTVGYELNLPVSKIVSDRWTLHWNAGATVLPDVDDHTLVSFNLGASAIYAVSRTFNLMLETVANFDDEVSDAGHTRRPGAVVISPGFRYAINHPNDAQTVIGLATPIGLTRAAPDFGIFIYASFEHFFSRPSPKSAK